MQVFVCTENEKKARKKERITCNCIRKGQMIMVHGARVFEQCETPVRIMVLLHTEKRDKKVKDHLSADSMRIRNKFENETKNTEFELVKNAYILHNSCTISRY